MAGDLPLVPSQFPVLLNLGSDLLFDPLLPFTRLCEAGV
jgi:hypothetical protein